MKSSLAQWMIKQRDDVFARWCCAVAAELQPAATSGDGGGVATFPSLPPGEAALLGAVYDGLADAKSGDALAIGEMLEQAVGMIWPEPGDALPRQLILTGCLRRAAAEVLGGGPDALALFVALDDRIEQTLIASAAQSGARARATADELYETRLLVESLYRDAESTDSITLHVSKLNDIAQGLSASLDTAQQLSVVGERLSAALPDTTVMIWVTDELAGVLRLDHIWHHGGSSQTAMRVPIGDRDDILARAYRLGELILEREPDPADQGEWYTPPMAVLAVPMLVQQRVTGVIALQERHCHQLDDRSKQEFVRSIANQSAIALENGRLYTEVRSFNAVLEQRITERTRELQSERDMLGTLNTIALEISSTLDEDLLMESSLDVLAKLLGVKHGTILLIDRDTEQLMVRSTLTELPDDTYARFTIGEGFIGTVAQQRQPLLLADARTDPRWDDASPMEQRRLDAAVAIVPLAAHHETQGVLLMTHPQPGYFLEEHLRLLDASANQIAIGIHNAMVYREVETQLMHRYEMQRRQEEAASQSAAILQSLSDGVIVCDSNGSVLTANFAVERILERQIEELVIWNLPELMKRLLGKRAGEVPLEQLLAEPRDEHGNPRTLSTTLTISSRVVSVTFDPVIASKGQVIGAVAVFRDITREVESDRLKTEFIGTVSHELRTPMTSIKGFTQLLAMGSLGAVNDTQKEFLGIIASNAERMIAIINDLLDITKVETGSVELDLRSLHMAEILSNVILEMQPRIAARQQQLTLSLPPGLPLVRADQRRFDQILMNLLSNAVKFTPYGGAIVIEARETSIDSVPDQLRDGLKPGTRYVQLDIRDTGVGIARDEQEKIFDRFYRAENVLKVEAGGTGLGLALVRPLIKLFGGRIWVASVLGEGSTFSFVIPVA